MDADDLDWNLIECTFPEPVSASRSTTCPRAARRATSTHLHTNGATR